MVKLFDYQKVALGALVKWFHTHSIALVVMATGLGKSIVAAFWAKYLIEKKGMRGLFLCHDNFILEQNMAEFKKVMNGEGRFGVFHGKEKEYGEVDVLFASFQTFKDWRKAFFKDEFDFLIVDESHHSQAKTYKKVINYFKPKYLLGVTATPDRMDEKDIRDIFGDEVIDYSLEEAIGRGWLTNVIYHVISDNLNTKALKKIVADVLEKGKKISIKQLNETIFIDKRDEEVASIIESYNPGFKKKTIIFCENIDHAENFSQFIPGSRTCHSKNSDKANRRVLNDFRDGKLTCVLSVDKFNEGIDVPNAEVIVFLRSTDSKRIFLQQFGRGLRKILGKENVIVLDFVANYERVAMVQQLGERIKKITGDLYDLTKEKLQVSGKAFSFNFTDLQLDVLEVIRKIQTKVYISDIPHLALEYSEKNELPADQVIAGTAKKLWWKCSDPNCEHEWQFTGERRVSRGTGCPACAGRVATSKNNLTVTHPELAKEYSDKNKLQPNKVIAKTFEKLWWKCSDPNCEHEWRASGYDRAINGTGCPGCAKRVATKKNNLAISHPDLAKEYSSKNELPVNKIIAGTNKMIWWRCSKPGCEHEWQATGCNRSRSGYGCPACSGRAATTKNNLTVTHPELAKEYSDKNNLPADQVIAGTGKKLWWKCSKIGCEYEWRATGNSRVSKGTGCPACARQVATDKNNLTVTHPELAKEYSDKNDLPADQVLAGTHKSLWWKCSKIGCEHEWQAKGDNRLGGGGCPECYKKNRRKKK